jgi:hypothetical protein
MRLFCEFAVFQVLGSQVMGFQAYQDTGVTETRLSACCFDVQHTTHRTKCKHLFDILSMIKAI